jgi:hypothetical protein
MGTTYVAQHITRWIAIIALALGLLASGRATASAEVAPQREALLECTTAGECVGGQRIDLQELRAHRALHTPAPPHRAGLLP